MERTSGSSVRGRARISKKGKPKKLALIAVSNKLLKQAFAVAKSGITYDPEYKSKSILVEN